METDEPQTTASPGDASGNSPNGRWHVGQARPRLGQRQSATVLNQITEEEGTFCFIKEWVVF